MSMLQRSDPRYPEFLISVGNVHATQYYAVTPAGTWPLASVRVTTQDHTATTTHTPPWAIIMVVIFIWFFFLSLLFLLARETRVAGYINVTLWAPDGQSFTEHIPVATATQRVMVFNQVGYLQGLIGQERNRLAGM